MVTVTTRLRLRAIADANLAIIVAVLLVTTLAGGWLAYGAYADTETTEERVVSEWEPDGTFDHTATVTATNSSLYDEGETLAERDVYSLELSPELDGMYEFEYTASDSGEVDGEVELVLQTQSVEQTYGADDSEPTVYWEKEETIETVEFESLAPGETVEVPFAMNMSAVEAEIDDINDEFGNPPADDEVTIVAIVSIDGTVNGEPVATDTEHALPITVESSTFSVDEPAASDEGHAVTESMPVSTGPSLLHLAIGGLLVVGGIGGLVGLGVLRSRDRLTLTETERDWLAYQDTRADFDEWISTVSLPADAAAKPEATAESLEDLVNVAIDMGKRVLDDPNDERYYVAGAEHLYVYTPPDSPADVDQHDQDREVPMEDGDDSPMEAEEMPLAPRDE